MPSAQNNRSVTRSLRFQLMVWNAAVVVVTGGGIAGVALAREHVAELDLARQTQREVAVCARKVEAVVPTSGAAILEKAGASLCVCDDVID